MTDKMIARKADGIGWLVFNNPERHNAVSLEMWEAAIRIIADFRADPQVRVIVVRGAGEKSFVSGADISKFDDERAQEAAVKRYEDATEGTYSALRAIEKPTIAMIQGYCIGGGANLAVCCDLRICSETAKFAIPAAKLGLGYGYARIRRLIEVVSPSFAKEIFFTARQFDAEEARVMGLANRVVPQGELEAYVTDYARTIAGNAPLTVTAIKQIVNEALKDEADRDLALCDRLVKACFDSEDYAEGRRAFAEKRRPNFKGR
ncbi:enoyl-CoA hydratase [Bosea sp. (in: a-proteobacteria)]|uniref:enoyl-CoA hydratase n=1 Tax=Bosea sp. (in: a-proteobacteria) TaxID=1871050 RepID=UPI0025C13B1F|nr:enoyl-CoA hydratase [Bosea sp. (in: a-proteobacteria)]MBR3189388.1 enoyl-CoA hydratase/isomerase family protein [Bosea sp. (in: a-proteobacteria)]